jgi:hypothetical protein
MEPVNVRNLEQIQEEDRASRSSRLGALLLASLGGAALVTVALVMAKRTGPPARTEHDPLAELVKSAKVTSAPAEQLEGKDVTFPGILSDAQRPTTALAAVKDERGRLVEQPAEGEARRLRRRTGCRWCRYQSVRCSAQRPSRPSPRIH